jgi:hypothetical protein
VLRRKDKKIIYIHPFTFPHLNFQQISNKSAHNKRNQRCK